MEHRYTSRDIVSIRNDIIDSIKQKTDKLTDFNESELVMVLVEVLAGVSDMLNFYLDNQANETFLMTARQPKNIRGILETINYKLSSIETARGTVYFAVDGGSQDSFTGYVKIPKYSKLRTNTNPVYYYTLMEEVLLTPEKPSQEAKVVQGTIKTIQVAPSQLSKSYKYYLPDKNVPLNHVKVSQVSGTWECVEDSFLELKGGMKYSVHSDSEGKVYIMFTFDYEKYLPSSDNDKVTVTYLLSDGEKAQVSEYAISYVESDVEVKNFTANGRDFNKNQNLICYNPQATYGALDEEDLILAKSKARNLLKTMDRYVTLADYKAGIDAAPWVLKSKVSDWLSDDDLVFIPHYVKAWLVNNTGTKVPQAQLDEFEKEIYSKAIAGTQIEFLNAEYVDIPIKVKFTLVGKGVYRDDVLKQVEDALNEYYKISNCYFGQDVTIAEVAQIVKQTNSDIRSVRVYMTDALLSKVEYPRVSVDTVAVVGDIYGEAREEDWDA